MLVVSCISFKKNDAICENIGKKNIQWLNNQVFLNFETEQDLVHLKNTFSFKPCQHSSNIVTIVLCIDTWYTYSG